jgi:flap endonuclease-1
MGLDLKPLLIRDKTKLESFTNKIVAIDAYNAIYQFLATIRGPDGLNLTDAHGHVTSHLTGLFYRNINFLSLGIKPIYVFDGKSPSLKSAEIEHRRQIKKDAAIKYEKAISEGNMEDARKYAQQTTSMKDGMVEDSKHFLELFGIPYIQAPSEGEATAALLTTTGHADVAASQDFDSILFGAKKLVRNFTTSGRRKLPNRNTYIDIEPEIIDYKKNLDVLGVTQEQLVDVGILIGTDFNPDGFQRVGPKTAIKMIKKH